LGHGQSPAIPFREAEQGKTFPTLLANVSGADISLPFRKYKTNSMMTGRQNRSAGVQELVAQSVSIGLAQYDALYVVDVEKYNRLYHNMEDVVTERKQKQGDQRRALLPLLDHPNLQVRMKAAHAVLAISPALARKAFESVRESGIFPQAMDAGMTLRALDNGTYVPS
jgi:hypothetical protein